MLRKLFITLSIACISFNTIAAEPTNNTEEKAAQTPVTLPKIEEGVQYITLPKLPSPEKEVIEIFSFNCPSCYRLDTEFKIPQSIEDNLPEGIKMKRYNLTAFGALGKELSEAWAIANVLGIQDEVSAELYNKIHVEKNLNTAEDIKAVFVDLGVDENKFDSMKKDFLVNTFMAQQEQAAKDLQPQSIPSFYINGQYLLNPRGFIQTSTEDSIKDYSRVTNYLLNLKK